jgi:hypothetical protein
MRGLHFAVERFQFFFYPLAVRRLNATERAEDDGRVANVYALHLQIPQERYDCHQLVWF